MGKVSSATIDTENVYEDLKLASQASQVPINDVDVDILAIHTKYILGDENAISVDDVSIFDDDEFFSDPKLLIEQSYRVRYYDKTVTPKTKLPKISISVNKTLTKLLAKIDATNKIKYTSDFSAELENAINRQILKYGFLIGIRNASLKKEIKRITSALRVNGELGEDIVFEVASGVLPKYPVDDALIYHYKEKICNEGNDPNASVLAVVSEGEVVIEYIKSQTGHPGRNLKGELIAVGEPKTQNQTEIKTTDKIEKIEDENSIKYISKQQGYVSEENGVYDIKEKLDVNEISLKTTGSIDAGLDSDVTINVAESDVMKDAIGAGMSIETSILNVQGSVAQGASITAKQVNIGGQTHGKSTIKANNATINVHLGYLECSQTAIAKRVESGTIIAKVARIESALGATIIAEEIYIKELVANCNLIASKLIVIDQILGSDNRFVIDLMQIPEYAASLEQYSKEKASLGKELSKMKQILESKHALITQNTSSVNFVKKRIQELENNNEQVPMGLINKLKDYQSLVYEYNEKAKQYKNKNERYCEVIAKLEELQDMIFDSKIINKGRWAELNDIKFELIEPRRTITYSTRENELARMITLKHLEIAGESLYELKKSNELPPEFM